MRSVPKWLEHKWDKQIEGFHDAIKWDKPQQYDKFYLEGFEAKKRGYTLKQEVLNYIFGTMK